MVSYYENYGPYVELVKNGRQTIDFNIPSITKENYNDHFFGITNIMKDGIEDPEVQKLKIDIKFTDGYDITYTLTDYWFNLIFWTFPIYVGEQMTINHIFDTRAITKRSIKVYFDKLIKRYRSNMNFIQLNNLIDDTIYKLKFVNDFAMYLANTVNFHDTLELMKQYPDFNASIHANMEGVPIEDVKDVGMKYANVQIDRIKNSEHCLRDSFISGEAINPKQFKEVSANIGTKPDGRGGVFPYILKTSFINGGVNEPESYTIDSSVGRTAQILQKMNVGTSGAFARLLEINNMDTCFHEDPNYSCNTRNFIKIHVKDSSWLRMYDGRYFKFNEDGPDYLLDADIDTHLIGRELYFRSPITCASYARGEGICRKCYGELYFVNRDINPGKIAAELLSSIYTQMLLSAKHLLESAIVEMKWQQEFYDLFEVNLNMISLQEDIIADNMYIVLDSNRFDSDDEDDEDDSGIEYSEFTPSFNIIYPDGRNVSIHTSEEDNIYITEDLNRLLKSKKAKEVDGVYTLPLDALKSIPVVFTIKIQNKELQRTLERSKHIIDRQKDTSSFTKDEIVKEFITANTEGNIHLQAIHLETLISNQMRDPENILNAPNWAKKNAPYQILTLSSSLTNSPSITVTLEYQKIARTLVNPISTKKRKPSAFDLFFMEQPQDFIVNKEMVSNKYELEEDNDADGSMKEAIYFVEKDKQSVGTC